MPRSFNRVVVFWLVTGTSSLGSLAQSAPKSRILQPVDRNQRAVVRGSVHPLAKPEFDAGRVDGSMKINGVSLVFKLSPSQQAALETLLREQQDRSSANYHKWLTPEQYTARFGMSRADLAKVTSWLQSEGLEINGVSRSRTRISFSGTTAQLEAAFRTEIHNYHVDGELHFANAMELSVPAAFAGTVLAVGNLSDLRAHPKSARAYKSSSRLSPHYTDGNTGFHYLAPADFATIYDLNPLYNAGFDGTGQSIAIMGQTAIDTADIDAFRSAAGLPARTSSNFQQIQVPNTGNPVISSGDLTEADLDLEWAQAVAPNATLIYVFVGNAPNFDAFSALQYTVDNNLAPVISITYGSCEANPDPIANAATVQQWAQQANSQGQTIIAASGDEGAADCDGKVASATQGLAVDVPASIPEVTGVGGTELDEQLNPNTTYWNASNDAAGGSALSYIPEIAWDDSVLNQVLSASGGGASTLFTKPTWQVGTNVPNDGMRDVPDIALSASSVQDPYLICSNQASNGSCTTGFIDSQGNLTSTGGTSFGAPAFAGIVALINQRTGSSQGNVNPTLYSLAESTPLAFHDITTGSNDVPCALGSPDCPGSGIMGYSADIGYDLTTGLGSLDASVLVNAWPIDFSILVNPDSVTIASPGGQGTAALSLNSIFAFTGTVSLTCTPQSGVAGLTCQISPTSVSVFSPNATLTIFTVGAGSAAAVSAPPRLGWLLGSSATLFAGIFLIKVPSFRCRRIGLPLLLLLACLAAGIGCGGSSSSPPPVRPPSTPPGNYTVKITGTSGNTSFSTNVSVQVQ